VWRLPVKKFSCFTFGLGSLLALAIFVSQLVGKYSLGNHELILSSKTMYRLGNSVCVFDVCAGKTTIKEASQKLQAAGWTILVEDPKDLVAKWGDEQVYIAIKSYKETNVVDYFEIFDDIFGTYGGIKSKGSDLISLGDLMLCIGYPTDSDDRPRKISQTEWDLRMLFAQIQVIAYVRIRDESRISPNLGVTSISVRHRPDPIIFGQTRVRWRGFHTLQ